MKHKTKKLLKAIGLVLVGALLCAGFLHFSGSDLKVDWLEKERNQDNFIELNDSYIVDGSNSKGIDWKVSDDGTIKLYGKTSSAGSVVVQTVELTAGKYTYSVGTDKVNVDKFYSYVDVNGQQYIAGTADDTFELVEDSTVQVIICWLENTNFGEVIGTTFRPIIVEGENAGSFYAK